MIGFHGYLSINLDQVSSGLLPCFPRILPRRLPGTFASLQQAQYQDLTVCATNVEVASVSLTPKNTIRTCASESLICEI
jgi:hypothetical protein